jgi:hypothetical protein
MEGVAYNYINDFDANPWNALEIKFKHAQKEK